MRRPVQALVVVALALAAASPSAARTGTVQLGAAMNDGGFASSDPRSRTPSTRAATVASIRTRPSISASRASPA